MRSAESSPSVFGKLALLSALALAQPACSKSPEVDAERADVQVAVQAVEQAAPVKGEVKNDKQNEKAAIAARVNAAMEAAKIENPTNKELIGKLFTFLLGDGKDDYANATDHFPYIAFKQAFGTYEGGDELSIGVTANHYASTMNVGNIATDSLAVFGKMPLEDKMKLAESASGVIPQIKDGAALYPKYGKLFDDGSFDRCPGDVDFNKEVRDEKDGVTDTVKEDPACKEGTLVANYHAEAEFSKLIMRMIHRLHIPASVVATTADRTMRTILGK
jgi:hypothetical protein